MKTTILMNTNDLKELTGIVEENNITYFKLTQDAGSGIGYTTDIEFESEINGRLATVTMSVANSDSW